MRNVQRAPAISSDATPFVRTLDQEADELDAIHAGLLRHLDAWRDAHESTIRRLAHVISRMDAIVARIEQGQA